MYFPYLYGRQGECRALEDLAGRLGSPQKVFPVIEPVVESPRDLTRALEQMKKSSASAYLILNPSKHKLSSTDAVDRWSIDFSGYIANSSVIRPTLEIRSTTSIADLSRFFTAYSGRQLGLSIRASHIAATDIVAAKGLNNVTYFLHSSADPSGYAAVLGAANCVEVRDSFRMESRNADYVGAEKFTSAHLLFAKEKRVGFSDYTLLPGKFNASGGPLGAAVIHMSFIDLVDNTLWVEHFVSDETRQYFGTQPTKLMQAMTKFDAVLQRVPGKFSKTPGLTQYRNQYSARKPTSPTYNKRQQISHHIDTVRQIL